jgi:hypothetical protein
VGLSSGMVKGETWLEREQRLVKLERMYSLFGEVTKVGHIRKGCLGKCGKAGRNGRVYLHSCLGFLCICTHTRVHYPNTSTQGFEGGYGLGDATKGYLSWCAPSLCCCFSVTISPRLKCYEQCPFPVLLLFCHHITSSEVLRTMPLSCAAAVLSPYHLV